MENCESARERERLDMCLEIEEGYDVVVVGGGTAGVFAAIAAARTGAKTLLAEKTAMLGGTLTNAYVNYPGIFHFFGRQIITGPAWELMLRLEKIGGAQMPKNEYAPIKFSEQQIRTDPFLAAVELERMTKEAGAQILMHTVVSYAKETPDGVLLLLCQKDRLRAVRAAKVVDCTGDANLVSLLGYATVKSEHLQPATYENRIEGYRVEEIDEAALDAALQESFAHGVLDPALFSWKSAMRMLKRHKLDLHIDAPCATTAQAKTEAELMGHETLARVVSVFRGVKGLEKLRVKLFAAECGIRESVRIVGEQTMTKEKYLSGYIYPDAISYCYYPIDLHALDGVHVTKLANDTFPTIPLGAMIPKGSKHCYCAGRCVSSDTDTNSAVRVQAPCMAMGTAAGVAAALTAKAGVPTKGLDFAALCRELVRLGVTLPQNERE